VGRVTELLCRGLLVQFISHWTQQETFDYILYARLNPFESFKAVLKIHEFSLILYLDISS